jgi:hypothetical protein
MAETSATRTKGHSWILVNLRRHGKVVGRHEQKPTKMISRFKLGFSIKYRLLLPMWMRMRKAHIELVHKNNWLPLIKDKHT